MACSGVTVPGAAGADDDGELDLVVHVGAAGRDADGVARADHRGRGLEEDQRLLRRVAGGHLRDVLGVVLADADHLAGQDRREQPDVGRGEPLAGEGDLAEGVALDLGDLAVPVEDAEGHAGWVGEADDAHVPRLVGAVAARATVAPMASRITELVLDCRDPGRARRVLVARCSATRWSAARTTARSRSARAAGAGGAVPDAGVRPVDRPDAGQAAACTWTSTPPTATRTPSCERLLALGRRPGRRRPGTERRMTWHVLADPEGNEFCLLRRARLAR